MLARSRTVLFTALVAVLAVGMLAGCAKKKAKPELRLPRTSSTDTWGAGGLAGVNGADASFGANQWGPGGAPGGSGFGQGFGMTPDNFMAAGSLPAGATLDESGSWANTASGAGVAGATLSAELEMVHFPYDSYDIVEEYKSLLDSHATWLQQNSLVMVQVEGHCDERGTEEYNISLGQKRADAVRTFLIERGIDANRISTNSYGKMRPLVYDENEESHALNRRAMFLVYSVDDSVAAAY